MKKDVYVLIGIGTLVILGMIAGTSWYQRSQQTLSDEQPLKTPEPALEGKGSPSIGPTTAPVNITEFLDPECESCRAMHPIVKAILKDYEGRVHYQLRYMPFHKNSVYAASMLEAAREQGQYWEALDVLFEKQSEWADHHSPKPELISEFLGKMGLDTARLAQDAKKPEIKDRIEKDRSDGQSLGIQGTPTFWVNGKPLENLGDAELRSMIDQALKP